MGLVEDTLDIAYVEIEHELGERTAQMYKVYFRSKKSDDILEKLQELLIDVLGPKRAEEKMKHIKNVLQVYIANEV